MDHETKLLRAFVYFEEDGLVPAAGNYDGMNQIHLVHALEKKGFQEAANTMRTVFQTIDELEHIDLHLRNENFTSALGCTHCLINFDVNTPLAAGNNDFKTEQERIVAQKLMELNVLRPLPDNIFEVLGLDDNFHEEYDPEELHQ